MVSPFHLFGLFETQFVFCDQLLYLFLLLLFQGPPLLLVFPSLVLSLMVVRSVDDGNDVGISAGGATSGASVLDMIISLSFLHSWLVTILSIKTDSFQISVKPYISMIILAFAMHA